MAAATVDDERIDRKGDKLVTFNLINSDRKKEETINKQHSTSVVCFLSWSSMTKNP